MVRRPIQERQHVNRGRLSLQKPELSQSYPVLASLSTGYPRFQGTLPTCYSPVRRFTREPKPLFSLDLHVLGTPPAFVLSQDQTLQLILEWSLEMQIHRPNNQIDRQIRLRKKYAVHCATSSDSS